MSNLILNSQINLAVRDFDGLRVAFRDYAQSKFSDVWTDFNDNSFANAIAEIVAYLGDNLHFYIDRQTQDNFLATTQDRQSAIELAALINYRPFTAQSASGQITLTLDDALFNYGVPIAQGFTVSNGSDIFFETTDSVTVTSGETSVTLDVIEGRTIRETSAQLGVLAIADGSQFQTYILSRRNVILSRTIQDINANQDLVVTVNGIQYTAVESLATAQSDERVFTIQTNNDNETVITFGNGEFGVIPADGEFIEATYRVLADEDDRLLENNGNVSAGTITTLVSERQGVVSVTNSASMTGGGLKESLEEIKLNAPASLTALNRAVSLSDYAVLARTVNGVAKSVATASESSDLDVIVYVAPNGGGLPSNALKLEVVDSFDDKKLAKTTVFARDPVYQNVLVTLKIFIQSTFKRSEVLNSARTAIDNLFDFENMDFGRKVLLKSTSTQSDLFDLYEVLESINGIERIEVQRFTFKPVAYATTVDNSGSLSMSVRGTSIRSNAERAEYKIELESNKEFVMEKAIVGTSTTLNDTSLSDDSIDLTLVSGTSTDQGSGFLQDSNQFFTTNEFAGQSLIDVNGVVFEIVSNTSDTINVASGTPADGNYSVVERVIGKLLQPNKNKSDRFRIISNTQNVFFVDGGMAAVATPGDEYRIIELETNEFTDQPLSGREDPVSGSITGFTFTSETLFTLVDSNIAGTYPDDAFNGYQMIISTGEASNLRATVLDYTGSTGTFDLGSPGVINVSPTVGDDYVCAPKFIVGRNGEVDDSSFSPTTTQFRAQEVIGESTDFFKNWKVRFTSGTHAGKTRLVNASLNDGTITIDDLPTPPSDGDTFEISKDYETSERQIAFGVVGDTNIAAGDTFFFNTSELAGDLLPNIIQILQVNADESSSDIILTGVGGST